MEEKFRDVGFNGSINVRYKNAQGSSGIWHKDQQELLQEIVNIVNTYQRQNITLTNRQLYYQLVASNIIPNAVEIYKRICTFLTDARYGGFLDWDAIEDRGRTPERHSQWDNVKDLINSAVYSYRLPRWQNQEYYVELFCEKEAMGSVLKPVANQYHIYFGCNKGYSSAATMYELYRRLYKQLFDEKDNFTSDYKKCVILYLGDHDASGLDMVRDIRERISEFLRKSFEDNTVFNDDEITDILGDTGDEDKDYDAVFRVAHLALTSEQVEEYNPPPNPAKITDPRAAAYIERHGRTSWELDSLRPDVLRRIAEDGIKEYIDINKYNAVIKQEKEEIQVLKDFCESKKIKDLMKKTEKLLKEE